MKSIGSIENLISFFRMYSISLALCCLKVAVWLCWSTLFKHESWSVLFILLYLNAGGHYLWAVCNCFIWHLQEGWKKGNRHSCNTVGGNDTFGLSHLFQSSSNRRKGVNVHFKYSGEVPGRVLQGKVEKHGLLVIFWAHFWRHHWKTVGNPHIWTVPKMSLDFYAQQKFTEDLNTFHRFGAGSFASIPNHCLIVPGAAKPSFQHLLCCSLFLMTLVNVQRSAVICKQ